MNFSQIIFEESPWYILLCFALGILYSAGLYSKKDVFEPNWRIILAFFRFSITFILALLLLVPLLKQIQNFIEKPTIVFAIDNSESMLGKDSSQIKNLMNELVESEKKLTQKGYKVDFHSFNSSSNSSLDNISFNAQETNISSLIKEINSNYEGRNLVSIFCLSDGINNSGISPQYINSLVPIHTIGVGDTTENQDVFIKEIELNKIVYKDNQFPIQVTIGNKGYLNKKIDVVLKNKNQVIETKSVHFNNFKGLYEIAFMVEAKALGKQQYSVELPQQENEFNIENNTKVAFIDVVDGKQQILLLANAPHPDIKAIQEVISNQKNYELKILMGDEINKNIKQKPDLVIYHQLPSKKYPINESLEKHKTSSKWFFIGSKTDVSALNGIQKYLQFDIRNSQTDDVFPFLNSNQEKFQFEMDQNQIINEYPPIKVPFGEIKIAPSVFNLLTQKVGKVETEKPILCISEQNDLKNVFFIGEGLWKWRIVEFLKNENFNSFDKLISKTIQFAATKSDKRKLKVTPTEYEFFENTNVSFDVEVYNDIYEKIYNKEIDIRIIGDSTTSNYQFVNIPDNNKFSIGNLKMGIYNYEASTTVDGKKETEKGEFVVNNMNIEAASLTSDYKILQLLARNNQGEFFEAKNYNSLMDKFLNTEYPDKIVSSFEEVEELLHKKWIFFILLSLISLEWAIRKYFGKV